MRFLTALLVTLWLCGCTPAAPPAATLTPTPATTTAPPAHSSVGFASERKFREHYRKHGREFGAVSAEEYLRLAQELRDKPVGGEVLEAVRPDRVRTLFDRSTGAFEAVNPDGTIRTFFKPNAGERYFRRQARRTHD